MVNVSKIVKGIANIAPDAVSHTHIKAPQPSSGAEFSSEISKKASEAAASYGKAIVQKKVKPDKFDELGNLDRDFALKRIKYLIRKCIREDDLIPIEEAAKEIEVLPINDDAKMKILRGCIFETGEKEAKVSKAAVYIAKYVVLDNACQVPNKFQTLLRTAMDEKSMIFDLDRFYSFFEAANWSVCTGLRNLKKRVGNTADRYINMDYMSQVVNAFEKVKKDKSFSVKVRLSDIFKPLDKYIEDLTAQFDSLVESGENIPDDLVKAIKKSLSEYNFDIRKVFTDYYGLLKECKTLEDVKTFYPELKFPTQVPTHDPSQSKYYLSNRLALGDFEESVIEGLQKLYLELLPYNRAFLNIKGSTSTNVANLNKAGFEFGRPSDNLLAFFDECKKTEVLLDKISQMSKEKLEPLITRHALRSSGAWKDFEEFIKTGKWMPIKLIRNRRMYPETSKYSTENLVETYLFNLFLRNPSARYSSNPLCRFDRINYLTDTTKAIINRTYIIRFLAKEEGVPANLTRHQYMKLCKDFEEFKKRFDLEAIGKSLEHIEDTYHRHFYRNYWSKQKILTLQRQMQESQDIAYEKVLWGEEQRKNKITIEDVKRAIHAEEGEVSGAAAKLIDQKELNTFKYQVSRIKDPQLREKFLSAIAQGRESDEEYFNLFRNILHESSTGDNIDETKVKALINIHEMYLKEAMEGTQNLTEAQYKEQILSKYKTSSGVNYEKILKDMSADVEYTRMSQDLIKNGSQEFLTELERRYGDDFAGMNEIIIKYRSTPKIFREKFASIYTNSTPSCPNIVLSRELDTFLDKIGKWHFERDEMINLDKERFGQFKDDFSQYIVIQRELKEKIWELAGENYETCDELFQKFYTNARKRTGESRGTGVKTWSGGDYPTELKILGKWGSWRLFAREATPKDIEKYGNVKYVFYDVSKTH